MTILVKIGHDLRDRFNGQRVNGTSVIRTRRDQADHFAMRIQQRAADLTGADRDIGMNVRRRESLHGGDGTLGLQLAFNAGQEARIKSTDRSLRRRDGQVQRVPNSGHAIAGFEATRMGQGKRGTCPVGNSQHGQPAPGIVAEDLRIHLDAIDHHPGRAVVAQNGRGRQHRALVVDEEAAPAIDEAGIAGANLDNRCLCLVQQRVRLVTG